MKPEIGVEPNDTDCGFVVHFLHRKPIQTDEMVCISSSLLAWLKYVQKIGEVTRFKIEVVLASV